jgi:hypothetical protein
MRPVGWPLVIVGGTILLACGCNQGPQLASPSSPWTVSVWSSDGTQFAARVWVDGSSVYMESQLRGEHQAFADLGFAPGPHTVEAEILASSASTGGYVMSVSLVNVKTGESVFGISVGPEALAVGQGLSTTFYLLPAKGSTLPEG